VRFRGWAERLWNGAVELTVWGHWWVGVVDARFS
jgi:hypothetical protein